MTLANFTAMMEMIKPPHWVHVRFPRGAMLGEPGHRVKQRAVLLAALGAFETVTTPGGKLSTSYRWEAGPVCWRGRDLVEGP